MTARKIGLHGSYNSRNFGDTLILKITHDWIKEHSKDNVVVFPQLRNKLELQEITGSDKNPFDFDDLKGLVFGPGGYLGEPPHSFLKRMEWSYRNYKRHIKWSKQLRSRKIPYMMLGVGVGPISNLILRWEVIKLFKNASYIAVRDEISRNFLVKWGIDPAKINVFCDVALSLPFYGPSQNMKKKIGLHLPGNDLEDFGKLEEFNGFIKDNSNEYSFSFIEDQAGQFSRLDKPNSTRDTLLETGHPLDIISYGSPNQLMDALKEFDVIITSKLHVGIVSYALGKPVISIPKHTKTVRFYNQIGRAQFCVPFKDITKNKLQVLLDNSLANSDNKNIMFDQSLKNRELLFEFLDSLK
ncbi:hypothetical protein C943_01349 [Mariniradius saccharolyticus AK6]|uniref:Polysaccharide pyruvyl transferase domain-containing protein n=1 Tax=Mariniradius saccharolyticus AK6 TaxID=1239962 RepID=M7XUB1_9BACT|nr:polysaccharide pyruvyl transferase family protein [Mariniradius saccharolyticus]EMS32087.1 hypothetical protein C943_01349 [Mariniradius saccharolyticus AK6]